jgi:hypothetical protein
MKKMFLVSLFFFLAQSQIVLHSKSKSKTPMSPDIIEETLYMIVSENYVLDVDNDGITYYDAKSDDVYKIRENNGEYEIVDDMDGAMPELGAFKINESGKTKFNGRECRKLTFSNSSNPQFSVKFEILLSKFKELDSYDSHFNYIQKMIKKLKIDLKIERSEHPMSFHLSMDMQGNTLMDMKEDFLELSKSIPDKNLVKTIQSLVSKAKP